MKAYILKCKPNAQFHFGETALDEDTSLNKTSEIIHSDTLFSSLVSVYAEVFGNPEKFIEKLKTQRISTAFHCLEHENKFVFFLPKPIHFNLNFSDFTNFKPFKKIKYISAGVWQKGLGADELLGEECTIIDGKYVCLKSEIQNWEVQDLKIIKENTLPKVHVHQTTTEDSIYYQTNIQIVDNTSRKIQTHFYFLSENELDSEVKVCFDILIDMGIGGERSTGCGRFESLEVSEQFPTMNFQNVKNYGLISLFIPKTEQEVKDIAYYQPIFRGGRRIGKANTNIDKEKYLQQVRMVSEGAVLINKTEGNVLNISSIENDIYLRSGLSFLLPLHPKLNNYAER